MVGFTFRSGVHLNCTIPFKENFKKVIEIHSEDLSYKFLERVFSSLENIGNIENTQTWENKKKVLWELDHIFQIPNANENQGIRNFYEKRILKACDEIEKANVKTGTAEIWQFYNDGFIIKFTEGVIGFDVIAGNGIWGWENKISGHLSSRLSDIMDVLCITHLHPDHFEEELAKALIAKGKQVILPDAIKVLEGAYSVSAGSRTKLQLSNGELVLLTHIGTHVYDPEKKIPLSYYGVLNSDGIYIIHTGDHDHTQFFQQIQNVDVLLARPCGVSPYHSDTHSIAILLSQTFPNILLTGHLQEIGHPIGGGRGSYGKAIQVLSTFELNWNILTWGEKLVYTK